MEKLKNNSFLRKHWSFIKYALVGTLNFLIDLGIYTLLANVFGWRPILANIVSVTISMTFSFIMNYNFVWRSNKNVLEAIVGFFTVSVFSNYLVQNVVLGIGSTLLGEGDWQNVICKICASMAGALTNYFGYKVVFTSDKVTNLLKMFKK